MRPGGRLLAPRGVELGAQLRHLGARRLHRLLRLLRRGLLRRRALLRRVRALLRRAQRPRRLTRRLTRRLGRRLTCRLGRRLGRRLTRHAARRLCRLCRRVERRRCLLCLARAPRRLRLRHPHHLLELVDAALVRLLLHRQPLLGLGERRLELHRALRHRTALLRLLRLKPRRQLVPKARVLCAQAGRRLLLHRQLRGALVRRERGAPCAALLVR